MLQITNSHLHIVFFTINIKNFFIFLLKKLTMTTSFTRLFMLAVAISLLWGMSSAYAQCGANELDYTITIDLASYPSEVSWELVGTGGIVASGACGTYTNGDPVSTNVCLTIGDTYTFNAYDDYGDSWNGGVYSVATGGTIIINNNGATPSNGSSGDFTSNCVGLQLESSESFVVGCFLNAANTSVNTSCISTTEFAVSVTIDESVIGSDFVISNDQNGETINAATTGSYTFSTPFAQGTSVIVTVSQPSITDCQVSIPAATINECCLANAGGLGTEPIIYCIGTPLLEGYIPFAVNNTPSGTVAGGPTFVRPGGTATGSYVYDTYEFTVSATGSYTITTTWAGFDGYLYLYEGFDPAASGAGVIALDDDFNGTGASQIYNVALTTGVTYTLVFTTYGSGAAGGAYTTEITGAGNAGIEAYTAADYTLTYAVTNAAGTIIALNPTPSTLATTGQYGIYSVSYYTTEFANIGSLVGQNISALQALTGCIDVAEGVGTLFVANCPSSADCPIILGATTTADQVCNGDEITLNLALYNHIPTTYEALYTANFNSGNDGYTMSSTISCSTANSNNWQIGLYDTTESIDGTSMAFYDDDGCGSGASAGAAVLLSPMYNLAPYQNETLVLDFDYNFDSYEATEVFVVEAYDGFGWNTILNVVNDGCGAWGCDYPHFHMNLDDYNINGNSEFQVRFTFSDAQAAWGWFAAVDNIVISKELPANYAITWTSASGVDLPETESTSQSFTVSNTGCAPETQTFGYTLTCTTNNTVVETGGIDVMVYPALALGNQFDEPAGLLASVNNSCNVALINNCAANDLIIEYATSENGTYSTNIPELDENASIMLYYQVSVAGAPDACAMVSGTYEAICVATPDECPTDLTNTSGLMSVCGTSPFTVSINLDNAIPSGGAVLFEENFDGEILPDGWTTTINGGAEDWIFDSSTLSAGANPGSGGWAHFDDDIAGAFATDNNVTLTSPVIDAAATAGIATLAFDYSHQDFGGPNDAFGVEETTVEVFDGTNWVTVWSISGIDEVGSANINVSAYLNPSFQVQFTYNDNGDWGWGAGFDNIQLLQPGFPNYSVTWTGPNGQQVVTEDLSVEFAALNLTQLCGPTYGDVQYEVTCLVDGSTFGGTIELIGFPDLVEGQQFSVPNPLGCEFGITVNQCELSLVVEYGLSADGPFSPQIPTFTSSGAQLIYYRVRYFGYGDACETIGSYSVLCTSCPGAGEVTSSAGEIVCAGTTVDFSLDVVGEENGNIPNIFTITGSTLGEPTYNRPLADPPCLESGVGTDVNYDIIQFVVPADGAYTIDLAYNYDGYANLYSDIFDPADACGAGTYIGGSDDFSSLFDGQIQADLVAGTTYFLIVSSYNNNDGGNYTVNFSSSVILSIPLYEITWNYGDQTVTGNTASFVMESTGNGCSVENQTVSYTFTCLTNNSQLTYTTPVQVYPPIPADIAQYVIVEEGDCSGPIVRPVSGCDLISIEAINAPSTIGFDTEGTIDYEVTFNSPCQLLIPNYTYTVDLGTADFDNSISYTLTQADVPLTNINLDAWTLVLTYNEGNSDADFDILLALVNQDAVAGISHFPGDTDTEYTINAGGFSPFDTFTVELIDFSDGAVPDVTVSAVANIVGTYSETNSNTTTVTGSYACATPPCPTPSANLFGATMNICDNGTFTLPATVGVDDPTFATFSWTDEEGNSVSANTPITASHSGNVQGPEIQIYSLTIGCTEDDTWEQFGGNYVVIVFPVIESSWYTLPAAVGCSLQIGDNTEGNLHIEYSLDGENFSTQVPAIAEGQDVTLYYTISTVTSEYKFPPLNTPCYLEGSISVSCPGPEPECPQASVSSIGGVRCADDLGISSAITFTGGNVTPSVTWLLNGAVVGIGASYSGNVATPADCASASYSLSAQVNCEGNITTLEAGSITVYGNPTYTLAVDPMNGVNACDDATVTYTVDGQVVSVGSFPYSSTIDFSVNTNGAPSSCAVVGSFQTPAPPTGAIQGNMFVDTDENGYWDAGEVAVAGVTVTLYTAGGAVVATTTTDENGYYLFDDLALGSYYVVFAGVEGYAFTMSGGDSHVNESGMSGNSVVTADAINTINAGIYLIPVDECTADAGSLSNAILCANEAITVSAMGVSLGDGDVLVYVLTDASGNVLGSSHDGSFGSMSAGSYTVVAIAGPDTDGDSIPDMGNECTVSSNTASISVSSAIAIADNALTDCTGGTSTYSLVVSVNGGAAPYSLVLNGQAYVIDVDDPMEFGPFSIGTPYTIEVIDANGCTAATEANPICTVPIELLTFEGEVQIQGNLLKWATATEINNSHFTLYHSTDGVNFTQIQTVAGAGNSNIPRTYQYLHKEAPAGVSYYRLTQTDFDGSTTGNYIVTLNRGEMPLLVVNVFPTPTVQVVNVQFTASQSRVVVAQIFDAAGKLVLSQNIDAINGTNVHTFNVGHFAAGVYTVTLNDGTKTTDAKFVKQ